MPEIDFISFIPNSLWWLLGLGGPGVEPGQQDARTLFGRDDRGLPGGRDRKARRKNKGHPHRQKADRESAKLPEQNVHDHPPSWSFFRNALSASMECDPPPKVVPLFNPDFPDRS